MTPKQRPKTLAGRLPRPTNLGKLLTLYRNMHGVSIRALAVWVGTSAATLNRIERGQAMDADTMLKLWAWLLLSREDQQLKTSDATARLLRDIAEVRGSHSEHQRRAQKLVRGDQRP